MRSNQCSVISFWHRIRYCEERKKEEKNERHSTAPCVFVSKTRKCTCAVAILITFTTLTIFPFGPFYSTHTNTHCILYLFGQKRRNFRWQISLSSTVNEKSPFLFRSNAMNYDFSFIFTLLGLCIVLCDP